MPRTVVKPAKQPAKSALIKVPPPDLKNPDIARRHTGLHIDTFLPIATKAGYQVEVVYIHGGCYQMRHRGPKEVTVMVDQGNVVRDVRG